ncbi:MAG: AI-2E family transporter [Candidatus Falkowbacteria bacterium]|nr:AI-2E family transporter [Candidatus Falkowbacteria bacterium]
MSEKMEVSISPRTVRNILLILVGIFFLWKLSDLVILLITALMVATALNPAVEWLNKKLSRVLSAALVIIGLILPLIYVLGAVVPNFISQFPEISQKVTAVLNNADFLPSYFRNIDLSQYFQNSSSYILESTKLVSNFFFQAITFIFMVFYLLIDGAALHRLVAMSISGKNRARVEKLSAELSKISGQYIRGNLLISLICASVTFIGLEVLHVPYALPLAIFAGIFDLLPLIGSTIGAIPSVILAFTVSPWTGLLAIAMFLGYQEVENDILAPNIYNKVLNLLPFMSFIAVIIGTVMLGVAGAFLALPIAAGIPTVIKYFEENHKKPRQAVK